MLCRMAVHLSEKVVVLYLDNSIAKTYINRQGGTISLSLFRLPCHSLNVANKHGITLIAACITTHLSVETDNLSWMRFLPEWYLLSCISKAAFQLWNLPGIDLLTSSCANQWQHYYTLENPLPLGVLGLNAFNQPWSYQMRYTFPSLALVPVVLSMSLAEHIAGQFRLPILVASCCMETDRCPTTL